MKQIIPARLSGSTPAKDNAPYFLFRFLPFIILINHSNPFLIFGEDFFYLNKLIF